MQIIANTTYGFLISATFEEVKEILQSVTGKEQKEDIAIGQKIPAIDYAGTIKKIKTLHTNYDYGQMKIHMDRFYKQFEALNTFIENTKNISE